MYVHYSILNKILWYTIESINGVLQYTVAYTVMTDIYIYIYTGILWWQKIADQIPNS